MKTRFNPAAVGLVIFICFCSFSKALPTTPAETQSGQSESKNCSINTGIPISLNGYTQVRYLNSEDQIDMFDVRRARLTLKGKLNKNLEFKLQSELAGSQQKLLDAELSLQLHRSVKLSAGQFKIPFSYENLISSNKMLTINRSQVVEAMTARGGDVIGNHNGRDIGLQLSGEISKFSYMLGLFNGSGINTKDLNESKDIAGRIRIQPLKQVAFGGSFYQGKYTLSTMAGKSEKRERFGVDMAIQHAFLSLSAEYIQGEDSSVKKNGWYVQASGTVIPEKVQMVLKYDVFDPDADVSDNTRKVITIGAAFTLDRASKIEVNYELKEESTEIDNNCLIAQVQFGF